MSVADQIQDHQTRCLASLISLRMLAQGEAGTPLPRWVVVEVAHATRTVLAEAHAAGATTRTVAPCPAARRREAPRTTRGSAQNTQNRRNPSGKRPGRGGGRGPPPWNTPPRSITVGAVQARLNLRVPARPRQCEQAIRNY